MGYQIGSADNIVGSYESSHLGIVFHYRKPTQPALLDIEMNAAAFDQKWAEYSTQNDQLFRELRPYVKEEDGEDIKTTDILDRMDAEDAEDWMERLSDLKSGISSEDVEPVIGFVRDHIKKVEGVKDSTGEPVDQWQEIPLSGRNEIMQAMPPYEIAQLYGEIKQSVSLTGDQKNG